MNIYCFSGLGADEQVFEGLTIEGATLYFVPWIAPLNNETLAGYALRLADGIDFEKPYAFMGLSFGGMIAYELTSALAPKKTFLISSATRGKQVNRALWLVGKLRFQRLIPSFLLKRPSLLIYHFFGLKTPEEKKLFRSIMKNTSTQLLRWAIRAIIHWEPEHKVDVVRIHGTNDLIIPHPQNSIDLTIRRGTHFCILQSANEISEFIEGHITSKIDFH